MSVPRPPHDRFPRTRHSLEHSCGKNSVLDHLARVDKDYCGQGARVYSVEGPQDKIYGLVSFHTAVCMAVEGTGGVCSFTPDATLVKTHLPLGYYNYANTTPPRRNRPWLHQDAHQVYPRSSTRLHGSLSRTVSSVDAWFFINHGERGDLAPGRAGGWT